MNEVWWSPQLKPFFRLLDYGLLKPLISSGAYVKDAYTKLTLKAVLVPTQPANTLEQWAMLIACCSFKSHGALKEIWQHSIFFESYILIDHIVSAELVTNNYNFYSHQTCSAIYISYLVASFP